MKCDNCNPTQRIKNTWGCAADRLHNGWEDFKRDLFKEWGAEYVPKYQCRYADLIEKEGAE